MKGISAALCNTSHHLSRGGSPTRTLKTLLLAVACPTSPASHINLTPAKLRHQCPSSPTPTGRPRLWNVREFFSGVIHGHHEGTRGAVPTTSSTAAAATPARVTTRQGRAPAAPARPRREPGDKDAARAGVPLRLGTHARQRAAPRCRDPALSRPRSPTEQPRHWVESAGAAHAPGSAWPSGTPLAGAHAHLRSPRRSRASFQLYRTTLWATEELTPCAGQAGRVPRSPLRRDLPLGGNFALPSPASEDSTPALGFEVQESAARAQAMCLTPDTRGESAK